MSIRQSREYAIRGIIESGIENEVSRDEFHFYNYCTSFGFKERMYECRDDLQRALDEVKNNKEQEINDKEQEIENTAADDENLAELENDLEHLQDEYDELQSADDLLTRLGYGIEEFDEYDNGESLETIVDLVNQLDSAFVDIPTGYGRGISDLNDTIKNWRESPANPDNGLVGKCFEPTDEETLLDIVATDGFKKWFRPEKVASELKESRLLPKVWYRGLSGVSGEEVDKLKATSKYSDYAGEYYAYTPATAMSYIGDLANGKLLAGFLNVPEDKLAVLDCKGSSFADIGFKSTVAEQCEVFLAFGFDEEPNNWQDFDFVQTVKLAKTKDTISFYLQYANARGCLLVVDKDFEEQEYSQNRLAEYFSGRVEYALEHNYTKTNFYAWNLAIRGDYWAVMFEHIHDFGGNYGKELRGTIGQDDIICVFAPNAYFKEIHNKGEFNPEDNRIFYSLFDVEQDFKQEMQAEKEKTMQQTQTTATSGGVSLSKHTENTAKLDLSGQPESVLQYIKMANHPFIDDEPYFNALTPEQQVFVRQYLDSMNNEREQNQTVSNNEIHPDEISWRDEIVYLSLRYEEIDGVSIYHDNGLMNKPLNQLSQVELEDRLNIAEYLLSEAMVRTQDRQVWNDLQKQVNEVQNEMKHRKQQEVQLAAANRYEQNAAQNPVFLAKDDNAIVMPFDDFVIAAMKDTGDSREEVIAFANEAFRSQYQAADGYLRAAHDSSTMYNAFDIEIDDKTYYATAPLEWVKEQARVGLSDRGWDLENARHNFLHSSLENSSLENNQWETAFHQLKSAADEYKKWRNCVCAFFNFRQPEITLQLGEWTQVAQFVSYNQEWEQLDNARLMIAEFTPQQAFEFLGVYQQYQRYVSLAEHNAEQGIDTPELNTQIAALERSLNEKVAQNLPQTENRQVLFDLLGTQMNLFDENEKTQEQGTGTPENSQPENPQQGVSVSENRLPEKVSIEEFDRRLLIDFGHEDRVEFQIQKILAYYEEKDGVSIYHEKGLMNKPLETLSFSELEDKEEVLNAHFNEKTPQKDIDELRAVRKLLQAKGLEIIATAADDYTPKNFVVAQWAKNNGFEFELATNNKEVFQKGNLKLEVSKGDSYVVGELEKKWVWGWVHLGQFDKAIPATEIMGKEEIKPTRQESVFFVDTRKETTDEFGRLSQFLSEMEQGISVPENSQETQPETVSDSLKEQQKTIFRQWAEENGYQPLELSHSFLSFVYGDEIAERVRPRPTAIIQDKGGSTCIVEFGRMGDPRPFERFALPMNVDEVRQALDNSEVGKMLAQRPKFSKMLNEITPKMKAVLEQTNQALEKYLKEQEEQGIRAIESSKNGVGTITTQYAQYFVGKKWNSQTIQDAVILPDGAIQLQIDGEWYHENALSYSKFERINDIAKQPEYSDLDILKLKAFARSYKDNRNNIHSDFGKAESAYNDAHDRTTHRGIQGFPENGLNVYNRVTAALAMAGVNSPLYDLNFDTNKIKFDPKTIANSFLGKLKEQEQGISASESSETVAVSQDLSGQPETVSDSLKEPVNTQECLALLLNADDSSLNNYDKQYRQLLSFAVENGFSLIEDEKIGAFHFEKSQSVFYANNSRNHLSVFVGCKDQYGRVLETKHWKSSEFADPDISPELKNAPEFNTGNEHQDWENWLNSPEYHSLKVSGFVGAVIQELPNEWLKLAKQELAEAENQFNLLEKFYPDEVKGIEYRREQVELQKKEVERLERLVEKQGVSASGISETVAVSQDLSGQPETQVPVVLTKEEKAQLKAAKDDLTVAKKELKDLRDKLKNTRPDPMSDYLQWKEEKRQAISQKQSEVRERSHQYDELSFAFKTKTGEITDLEKEILTARLSGSLKERFDIAFRELRTQKKEIGAEYDALKLRIENKDFYEFEIQSVMQDAVGFYSGSRGMATLYHKGEPLPLTTDREKAIAYLLQVELPTQLHDELGKPFNALARKIKKLDYANRYIENANGDWGRYYEITQNDIDPYIDLLEDTENQLMKGSIEERAEINLTYDINTEYGKQKIRELFYNSRHDENQAELFEKVFAMAQKLNVEVRHALRDPHKTFSKRNATTTTLGWYQLNENSARVKHGGKIDTEEKGEVLLHELVHSVTSRAMLLKEQGHTELLNPAQVKAIDEIEKIYKIVLDKAEELGFEKYQKVTKDDKETFVGDYGLKNSHEFIAELSNPVFREKLKQVAMFDDTVKAMTEVATGVEKTETAYDRLTAALYQIIDNYEPDFGAKYEQAKYGNIKMHDIFSQPKQEQKMKISNDLFGRTDGFSVHCRTFDNDKRDYGLYYKGVLLNSFKSPEYAVKAIQRNETALLEQYHTLTYQPFTPQNDKAAEYNLISKIQEARYWGNIVESNYGYASNAKIAELEKKLDDARLEVLNVFAANISTIDNPVAKKEVLNIVKEFEFMQKEHSVLEKLNKNQLFAEYRENAPKDEELPHKVINGRLILSFDEEMRQRQYHSIVERQPENAVKQDAFAVPESIEKEQTMKTSQDILAEVMNKYETHIDSKDGLMSKPLHWLSASELEDRESVLYARIDKAIQYDDHETEERLELEYIKVENEKERRETLSGNLKEVLEKQPETLSVRDFIVLAENREELKRQLKNAIEKGGMSVKLTAIEDKIKAFNQPEKFSIDDRQAFFEYSFRKADMALSENRFLYGENDKSVQEKLAERTKILQKLATLSDSQKEQTAEKGVVSSPKEDMSGDLFLSSTQALLYWELENAIHWRYQYIAEQKEIPIPQSFIDTETARIEYCSKELNERLYGDEYQKYRDMFPEKIKEIQDDFNRMVKNLKTSPETAVKHDLNTLPEQEQTMKTENSLPENSVKQDAFGLPENYQVRAADFDDFNPNLDGKTITANTLYSDIYTDIKPEQQGKTVGEVLRSDENALWDAEFWGELVGHGTVKVSDDLVAQVIETQRSEVLEEILSCGNVPFTKEHIEALYEREPELIQEVANDYNEPKIKALAKEVVQTAEIGLKKQAFNNMFALLQVSDKINALEKRLQKQPNASAVQTELKELKHEQDKLEEEYDKILNRAFDAGIPLKEIRNGAKRQHAEFSGKPIQAMQQLVDKLDKAYPINKGEPFVKLDFFDDSKENERSNATLSITATELFFREVDKYDKRHTIDEYAFFDVKIVGFDGKDLKNGFYGIYKTEDIIENHSGLFGFLLNKNSFSPNPQQEKADENLALALSDYLDDKVKNELPAYLEKIADYKALPSVTGVVSLASKKEAQAIRAFNERLQEHLQNNEIKRDALGLPETAPMTEQEIFSDWKKALNHYADMDKLAQDANWGVDIYELAELHKNEPALREKIEQLWTACNYHSEVPLLQTEKYEVFEFDKNTPKFTLDEIQALGDGVRLYQADEKVKNAERERARNPSDKERHDNLQDAIAMRDMLKSEIKESVQAAMDSGKPYIVDYEGSKPFELVVTQNGNLKMALGSYEKEPNHNFLFSTANGEVALNAEQRSSPERVAEVLKYNFQPKYNHIGQKYIDIGIRLALINYPNADKVFSEQQIKDTLNKCLKSSFKEDQLAAIHSPRMKDEWLKSVGEKHNNPEVVAAAHKVLAERQDLSSSDNLEPENHTANKDKGGFSLPEHEEEPATVADDDGYERD